MISTIKVFNDAGDIVGQEVVSGDLILHSTVTEDGLHTYSFNATSEVNRLIMVCPEEGELYYQVFENVGQITGASSPYSLESEMAGKLSQGSELFIDSGQDAEDIGDGLASSLSYINVGAVVSNSKDGKITSTESGLGAYYAFNFYNGKTSKLIASLPLVSSYRNVTTHAINVKLKNLGERKVDLYFIKEA